MKTASQFALPFPHCTTIDVIRDTARPGERPWQHMIRDPGALVCRLALPADGDGDCDYSPEEWQAVSAKLVTEYPDCYFSYI